MTTQKEERETLILVNGVNQEGMSSANVWIARFIEKELKRRRR